MVPAVFLLTATTLPVNSDVLHPIRDTSLIWLEMSACHGGSRLTRSSPHSAADHSILRRGSTLITMRSLPSVPRSRSLELDVISLDLLGLFAMCPGKILI